MMGVEGLGNAKLFVIDGEGNEVEIKGFNDVEANTGPWYQLEEHFNIEASIKGIKLTITPAGWVYALKRWIEEREKALKYCKHSKRRSKLKRSIKAASRVLDVCIEDRIGLPDALEKMRGEMPWNKQTPLNV